METRSDKTGENGGERGLIENYGKGEEPRSGTVYLHFIPFT